VPQYYALTLQVLAYISAALGDSIRARDFQRRAEPFIELSNVRTVE
jgi:hypothetical protein